jgi:transcriptional regulator with XRE-family HTH domain
MTSDAFRAALDRLGLTQAGAARLLGVNDRTARKWACGETPVPETVRRLLLACESFPSLLRILRDAA